MKLVITEKPSVAQSIAKVIGATNRRDGYLEGNDYIVSWCVGHLIELAQPQDYDEKFKKWRYEDLPILPNDWKYKITSATKKQYKVLKELMFREDVESLVEATDAGREGELIFRLVYHQCKCVKPFERLWISSMEDEAIVEGFQNLKSGTEYDALYEAAVCRERADWMVGINATRLFSTLYGQTLNIGRVMTPTLAIAVERESEINNFKSENFYTVILNVEGMQLSSEKFLDQSQAEKIRKACEQAEQVLITKAEKKERQEKAPALFDLTNLQREANRKLGYTAQQTLDYAQSLYEKKLVSYPRTDSRFLTEDMEATVPELLLKIQTVFSYETIGEVNVSKIVNSKKVTDHHAIIPTGSIEKVNILELPSGEQEILNLIVSRLMEAVSEPSRYAETVIEATCVEQMFKTKGKQILELGWKKILLQKKETKEKVTEEKESMIPYDLCDGKSLSIHETSCKEGKTKPKAYFTEDTLLSAMERAGADETPDEAERKGLGTPATRAGVIEKLVRIGFLERKGDKKTKYLIPTKKGMTLVTVIPEMIQSPSMTADWEQKLLQIEKGAYESGFFNLEIRDMITELISNYKVIPDAKALMKPKEETIGKCPCCGSGVIEKEKGYFCNNRDCRFVLWKANRFFETLGKKMNKSVAEKLLNNGKVKLKKCKSAKTGKTYDTTVVMKTDDNQKTQFTLDFSNGGK